ncbi:hypothetical protein AURDEDRAFT_187370 [Auricularia subglabra TFB-10046 SS5]|nr:hypothetical protein AURDEDRAFT_187370 [Auricularia subglabra TFB-10046 SS5]
MSSLPVPPHPERNESDSDDEDYVPPAAEAGSDSETSEVAGPAAKKPKTEATPPAPSLEERKSAWDAFQTAAVQDPLPTVEPRKMIQVLKTFRFAGLDEIKVVQVPADSDDARKWPLWQPNAPSSGSSSTAPTAAPAPAATSVAAPEASGSQPNSGASTPRPGPRKRKTRLASPPRAKPKKLSTLEKSALDWQAHVASTDGLRDDLDAARRSGAGFLDKTDFLDRVGERRDNVLASASVKRKR